MAKLSRSIVFKALLSIVVLLSLFTFVIGEIGYNGYTKALMAQYSEGAFRTAKAALTMIDGDDIESYENSNGETEEYKEILQNLQHLCDATNATFIYLIIPDRTDYKHITFIFSTKNSNSDFTLYDFGYVRKTTNDDYRQKYKNLYEGVSDQELVFRDKGTIETDAHITAMMPLKNSDDHTVGIVCVQRQMDILTEARDDFIRDILTVLILGAILVIAILGLYLVRMYLEPVTTITEEALRFANENVTSTGKLKDTITNNDEIGDLAGAIDKMEDQIHEYVDDLTKITAEKERINTELNLANKIQESMLPNSFPPFPERKEFDIYALMHPAKEVGGDFYDFFMIDDDHLCMMIADVSGKGIPAALFMMAAKIIVGNNARMELSPSEILENANKMICDNNQQDMFVTVWVGVLEISTGKLITSNAGHEYPVFCDAGGDFILIKDPHGFVVGGMPDLKYKDFEIDMKPGSKLFIYTDGVPEASNKNMEMFGIDNMIKSLNDRKNDSPMDIIMGLRADMAVYTADGEQFDDLTMLCIEYNGAN